MKEKTTTVGTRLAPHIAKLVKKEAKKDGLQVSVWLRKIILKELKKRGYF